MKKRILVLLSVVALMVVMLAMSVVPAFAAWDPMTGCKTDDVAMALSEFPQPTPPSIMKKDRNGDDVVCVSSRQIGGERIRLIVYDNRP
jgi:hypothetical protein